MNTSDMRRILEPFATTKIHNPNGSDSDHTTRVLSVRALEIKRLVHAYDKLLLAELEDRDPEDIEVDTLENQVMSNVIAARHEAEKKAWKSLAGYKFEMFGYWAAAWVKYNQLLPRELKSGNPFRDAVKLARQKK